MTNFASSPTPDATSTVKGKLKLAGSLGGTADLPTVTTNANLTGPITSSGNATSIASQTGTGTKFVVDTSPTIVTPTIDFVDTSLTISDAGNTTKKLQFDPSNQSAGVTRILSTPDYSGTIATIAGTETLTGKTLTSPTIADFTNMAHDHGDADDGGVLVWQGLPDGAVVQVAEVLASGVATGTTVTPYDDTIPQITEGDQYMSVSITPKSTTNKLYIEASCMLASSAANQRWTVALHQDAIANALAVGTMTEVTGNVLNNVPVYHEMAAGTTSGITFRIRAGANGAGTTTFNGEAGARKYGAITKSWIRIIEGKA